MFISSFDMHGCHVVILVLVSIYLLTLPMFLTPTAHMSLSSESARKPLDVMRNLSPTMWGFFTKVGPETPSMLLVIQSCHYVI